MRLQRRGDGLTFYTWDSQIEESREAGCRHFGSRFTISAEDAPILAWIILGNLPPPPENPAKKTSRRAELDAVGEMGEGKSATTGRGGMFGKFLFASHIDMGQPVRACRFMRRARHACYSKKEHVSVRHRRLQQQWVIFPRYHTFLSALIIA